MRPLGKYHWLTVLAYGLAVAILIWVSNRLFSLLPSERERDFVAAAVSGDYHVLTRHIENGVDMDAVDKEFSALTVAVWCGSLCSEH